jgi:hypothetical protein
MERYYQDGGGAGQDGNNVRLPSLLYIQLQLLNSPND